jgi:hypothetical protein
MYQPIERRVYRNGCEYNAGLVMAKVATRSASLRLGPVEEKPWRDNLEALVPTWEDDINISLYNNEM